MAIRALTYFLGRQGPSTQELGDCWANASKQQQVPQRIAVCILGPERACCSTSHWPEIPGLE